MKVKRGPRNVNVSQYLSCSVTVEVIRKVANPIGDTEVVLTGTQFVKEKSIRFSRFVAEAARDVYPEGRSPKKFQNQTCQIQL